MAWMELHSMKRAHLDRQTYLALLRLFVYLETSLNLFTVFRCLMATNDIKAGDVIFQEKAISVGPNPISSPQCIECCSKVRFKLRDAAFFF